MSTKQYEYHSHAETNGNECTDSLAKIAINSQSDKNTSIINAMMLQTPKKEASLNWQMQWEISRQRKGIFYASIQLDIPARSWFVKHKLVPKKLVSTLSFLFNRTARKQMVLLIERDDHRL